MEAILRPRGLLFTVGAQAAPSPSWPLRPSIALLSSSSLSSGSSSSCFLPDEEQQQQQQQQQEVWTAEQLDIVAALLRTRPKPFPVHRPPLPPRVPSRYRPVGVPARRLRLPDGTPRPAKDKQFLTRLAAQISSIPPDGHVFDVLRGIEHLLVRGSLSATIRELGHLGLPLRALETFEWQQQCTHLWPDERTLCTTIEVLAQGGEEEKAWGVLCAHASHSSSAFEALTRGLTTASLLQRAMLAKEKAENSGIAISQGLYAELILLASRLNKVKEMRKLVEELGSFGELCLGLEHCTSIMAACRKAHAYDTVLRLFHWWKQAGFHPNVVMYQIVMTSLSDLGKPREALAIYWEMEKNGCAPHLPVYTALFEVCMKLGDASRALRLFAQMRESNIMPTHNIYTNLIKICKEDGRFGKAKEFLEVMRKEGFRVEDLDKQVNTCT